MVLVVTKINKKILWWFVLLCGPDTSYLISLPETDITVGQYNYVGQPGQNISQISDGSCQ